ncbi:MAG: response regulator transcription factor [Bryobacteraceae bacterium]|jgi:two-component system NarL family response regulator
MERRLIRILVVDDHALLRAGLDASIGAESDMQVVAAATTGKEALALFRQHQPDVTLMDLKMPVMGGVEAIQAIRGQFPSARVIVLSTYEGDEDIYRALAAGATTYLLKDTLAEDLVRVIRDVFAGGRPLPAPVAQRLAGRMLQPELTARELDVLRLIAKGMRNKEIAAQLGISDETTQGHVKNILLKFGLHDRTEAVTVALRRGIVHLD